jgi:hypothetical protein
VIEKGSIIVENTAEFIKERYGKGYHLSLLARDEEQALTYSHIEHYKQLFEKHKLKAGELEHLKG